MSNVGLDFYRFYPTGSLLKHHWHTFDEAKGQVHPQERLFMHQW